MYASKDYSRFTSTMLKLELKDRQIAGRSKASTKVLMIAMLEADDAAKVEPVIEESAERDEIAPQSSETPVWNDIEWLTDDGMDEPEQSSINMDTILEAEPFMTVVDDGDYDELFGETAPAGDEVAQRPSETLGCDVVILTLIAILKFMWKHAVRPILAALVRVVVKQWKRSPWEMYNGRLQVRYT